MHRLRQSELLCLSDVAIPHCARLVRRVLTLSSADVRLVKSLLVSFFLLDDILPCTSPRHIIPLTLINMSLTAAAPALNTAHRYATICYALDKFRILIVVDTVPLL